MVPSSVLALAAVLAYGLSSAAASAAVVDCSSLTVNFTHSWESDPEAAWHIHSLTRLDSASTRCDRSREHDGEVIISALESSVGLEGKGHEVLEGEWKEREVGEGFEETVERAWRRGGTCIPTFDPKCSSDEFRSLFPSSDVPEGADAVPYILLAHRIHQVFDTLALLEAADITPSEEVTYSLAEIQTALSSRHPSPQIQCDATQSLLSISYPLTLSPPSSSPTFAPLQVAVDSSCPAEGIFYHPSLVARLPINRGKRLQSKTWDPITRPSPRPITLSSLPTPSEQAEEGEDKSVKARRLGVFAGGNQRRAKEKEGKQNEGQWGKKTRDEL